MANLIDNYADLFDGCGQGSLHICLVNDPASWSDSNGDRHIERLDFHTNDWEALYLDELHCSTGEPYVKGEDIVDYTERNRKIFQQSIPEYPMLGRIFDMYEDYLFSPEEVKRLRDECLKVKASSSNHAAVRALRKLIYACDQASKGNYHLLFSCD